ncbi:NAD-dependent epimerase/dehydratase family protein [Rhodococcus sp. NPDC004095]
MLVTGSAGFIGRSVTRAFTASGADVHGVLRSRPPHGDGVRRYYADLTDPDATTDILRSLRPEIVIHLASHVSGNRSLELVATTLRDNLISTVNVLTTACNLGTPLVMLTGSMDVTDPPSVPSSPYAAAKSSAATYADMFRSLYGLPVVTLRPFMVYGPGQTDETMLVPYVIRTLLAGESPQLSRGSREVDWVYVDDVAAAFVAAAKAADERILGRTFDIGTGVTTSVRRVVERIAAMVADGDDTDRRAEPEFGALPDRPLEFGRIADPRPAFETFGWSPTTPLDEGLARTVAWYRQHP